jgi:peptide/nickel transport system substrate-binding protein
MQSRQVFLSLCALAGMVVAGCGGASGSGDDSVASNPGDVAPASGKLVDDATFRYALSTDPGALDLAVNPAGNTRQVMVFAYDSLVASPDGRRVVSNLATRWTVTPRRLQFTIHDGVTCSDGSAVTPSVIARSFERYKDPRVQYPVFGSVSDWQVAADDAAGTVTFSFGQPVGFPLQALVDVPVVCGEGLRDPKLLQHRTSGTGPYVLTRAASNDRYVLSRRDGYRWGPGGTTGDEAGLPKTVELRVVQDRTTMVNLLVSGELDGAASIPQSATARISGGTRLLSVPLSVMTNLYNQGPGHATGEAAVRKALTMALDRDALATVMKGRPGTSLIAPLVNPCPDPAAADAIPGHDVAAAEKLLDQAGWRAGSDGVRVKDGTQLKLRVLGRADAGPEEQAAVELVDRAWRQLGARVTASAPADSAALQALVSGDWDVMPVQPTLNAQDPSQLTGFLAGPPPPSGTNFAHIDNRTYERESSAALAAGSTPAACEHWNAGERALFEQADMIPVVTGDALFAMGPHTDYGVNFTGVVPTSVRMHAG